MRRPDDEKMPFPLCIRCFVLEPEPRHEDLASGAQVTQAQLPRHSTTRSTDEFATMAIAASIAGAIQLPPSRPPEKGTGTLRVEQEVRTNKKAL